MMASGRTWIVVLDDSRARFFKREISGTILEAAPELKVADIGGYAQTPQSRRAARDGLLREALATTNLACERNECDRIVVIAPDRVLTAFRKLAPDKVRARLWRERAGEVAALSPDDIAQSVEVYFRVGAD
jgi:protein required for attachment to host cells